MTRIIGTQDSHVTLGVLDKDAHVVEHLKSVTFLDDNGTAHTVFAHVNGPFHGAEDIVEAWLSGCLHTYQSHALAAQVAADSGDTELEAKLTPLATSDTSTATAAGNGA